LLSDYIAAIKRFIFNIVKRLIMKLQLFFACILASLLCTIGCSKNDAELPPTVNKCIGKKYTIETFATPAIGTQLGSITVLEPLGDTLSYSLDGLLFQSSTNFGAVAAGNYFLRVKNQHGCRDSASISIGAYGPLYAKVKAIIQGFCGPCHLNGTLNGGKNFDTDASIVASWDRIHARTVLGIPGFMPTTGQLTTVDKQKITDWVNAGHLISN